jgi:DNA helicase-2/ATP-dependent DNA helicase PcrA
MNKIVVAAAGSGKTRRIVWEALQRCDGRVLLTTFTEANEAEIRRRFIDEVGCVPGHVTVQTWYSFLLQHGARPFQGAVFAHEIRGLVIPEGQSARGTREADVDRHYFTSDRKIYADKLAKFAIRCNATSGGAVIDRISRIYKYVYVDEVQDIAGHDLDFMKLLLQSRCEVMLVGDPRQSVYATSNASRNRRFRGSQVLGFFEDPSIDIERDESSLRTNYRCVAEICALSDRLYPDLPEVPSGQAGRTGHDGVFLVASEDVDVYLRTYQPVQLRYNAKTSGVRDGYPRLNFGIAKGIQFDRALIFPTSGMVAWLKDPATELAATTRARLYVALTRARFSVGIVCDEDAGGSLRRFTPPESQS